MNDIKQNKLKEAAIFLITSFFIISAELRGLSSTSILIHYSSLGLAILFVFLWLGFVVPKAIWFSLLFFTSSLVSTMLAYDTSLAFHGQYILLYCILSFLVFYNIGRDHNSLSPVLLAFIFTALFFSVTPLLGFNPYSGDNLDSYRYSGATANPNTLASYVFIGMVSCTYFIYKRTGKLLKFVFIMTLVTLALFLLDTGSRKFIIYYALSLIAVMFMTVTNIWRLLATSLAILAGTFLLYEFGNVELVLSRTDDLSGGASTRLDIIKDNLLVFMNNPVFGVGLNHSSVASTLGSVSHNQFVEPLVLFGVIGALCFFGFHVKIYADVISRNWRLARENLSSMIVLVLFLALFFFWFGYSYHLSAFYWSSMGLLYGLGRKKIYYY